MKLYEAATAIIVGVYVYWVVMNWLEPQKCLVDIGKDGKVIQTWMNCDEVPKEWKVIKAE